MTNSTILWITFLKTGARRPVPPAPAPRIMNVGSIGEFGEFGELQNRREYEVYYDEDQGPLQWYK